MQNPLPQTTSVPTANFRHNVFRINAYDNDLTPLLCINALQNLTSENHDDTPRKNRIILLLNTQIDPPFPTENANRQAHLQREPQLGQNTRKTFLARPGLEIIEQTELVGHPHHGHPALKIVRAYRANDFFAIHIGQCFYSQRYLFPLNQTT